MDSRFGSPVRSRLIVLWLSGLLLAWQSWCNAQSVVLTWTPSVSPNIVGYNIYYGPSSGNYTNEISVGAVTSLTVSGLTIGSTYYFAATALNSSGLQSAYSTETPFLVPEPIPSVSIANVPSGTSVTNAAFTVTGLASDSVGVANVFYSLNGSLFTTAAINGTAWNASVTLAPGTNIFAMYAVDTLNNYSVTDTVNIVYTPVAALTVTTTGQGNFSPNYNGALLQIGQVYTMTATAVNGFMFTNWTGGISSPSTIYTNGSTVQFVMANNLVVQANFVDTNKPFISITNIMPGMQVVSTPFTVMGVSTDNVAVANVYYSLDGASVQTATINGKSWKASLPLTPGTNTLSAYAVDGSGNVSATANVVFDYVVTTPLIVQTNGQGIISPNYNGSQLQIGATYAMTATALNGFQFSNWAGSTNGTFTQYTTGSTVQFTMFSNLVMQANFVDTNKPFISITNITQGIQVTGSPFTVMGMATDNVAVATVYYSLDGAPVQTATINGKSWNASLPLNLGTNTLAAYAVDGSGNVSVTATVNFDYVPNTTLAVQTNGQGVISPNYNGSQLQVGGTYAMTATGLNGFRFSNWAGTTNGTFTQYTNGPTVQFTMFSNLVMQANFLDTNIPVISITNIPAGLEVSNSTFTVMGTASDNVAVSNVQYSVNGASFVPATLTGNSWSAAITMVPGTNSIAAYANSTSGNVSPTSKASIFYFEAGVLTVKTRGKGNVGPNYNGQHLRVGTSYSMTAAASAGFVFTNWTSATNGAYTLVTNSPTVQFTMVTNLVMQANFNDLIAPYLAVTNVTSGMVWTNPSVTVIGVATDDQAIASVNFSLNGAPCAPAITDGIQWNAGPQALLPGTNIFSVYAQATNGNLSVTDKVTLVYAVSNQLTIQISGRGTISPNDSNAWLRVGENYTMSAGAAPGMLFTNWTGSTNGTFVPYTRSPTVQFMMFPGLVMQANFLDTIKPNLAITNVTSGMIWTNPTFTVMGVATDDEAMATVNCSLNGSPYLPVNTANNWTNWNETLQLQAGTNLLSVYALATNNDVVTNRVAIVYAVSNQLQIQISGRGYISPNYSNAWLRVGENYTMSAGGAPGMLFTNWTGTTNGTFVSCGSVRNPTVQFMMFSNLVMQANFLDTLKPYLALTNVTSGMTWTNPTFTVMGVATDDEAMATVNYSLNGSPYLPVNTSNNWTNWNETLPLQIGTNLLSVYALATNNDVVTNRVAIVYAVSNQLQIQISGRGYISPNYSNAWLRVGENYTMSAGGAPGMLFTNWTGTTNGTFVSYGSARNPTVQFMMFSNLVMQANFLDTLKPYLALTNVTSGMTWTNPTFTVMGVATDDEAMATVNYSLNGSPYSPVNTVNNWTNWNETLQLQIGTNLLSVYAMATNNDVVTNRVAIVYAVSNQLQIQISGRGYISPNYSNAWLRLGENYTMSAGGAPGMLFTNWTGATNGTFVPYGSARNPTVQFMMSSNLVMQANFLDTLKPYLALTNVTSGMIWTNPNFTVMGVATDDEAMATVNYSLNGSPWSPVNSVNNWTNWNETLPLQIGTNLLSVYALATNNDVVTNRVAIVYAVSNQLQVQISGRGYISPNYSNAWLRLGENYTMSAGNTPGMLFTNWTGTTNGTYVPLTRSRAVQFMMSPNLVMQANFLDTLKPYLALTNVTSGMIWTNSNFTVMGVATDDEAMATVKFSFNGSPWAPVNTLNNWTNWNEALQLHAGTNLFSVYALATNNNAITQSVAIVYAVSNQLSIETEGLGFLSPNYSNAWMRIGQNYSMTALPSAGFMFTNWVVSTNFIGGAATNKPLLQFMMASNLTLQANFTETARPTLTVLSPASGTTREPISTASVTGTAKDVWGVAMVAYQLNGGAWTSMTTTNSFTNWIATVQLNAGTNTLSACAMNLGGNCSPTNTLTLISTNSTALQFGLIAQPKLGKGFNFSIRLSAGLSGRIEVSTNLVNWSVLTNFTETNGVINLSDPNATAPQRFYRAVVP